MSFFFSALKRQKYEDISQFDNRISNMLPIVAGYAFFDLRNYDPESGEFSIYIEWDEELNRQLAYPLPSGGYFIKATGRQACMFHDMGHGIPVYMKPVARNGKIYSYKQYLLIDGRPFSVEFSGANLLPIEDRFEELGCRAALTGTGGAHIRQGSGSRRWTGSGFYFTGSQSAGSSRSFQRLLSSGSGRGFAASGVMTSAHQWEYEFEYMWQAYIGSRRYSLGSSRMFRLFGSGAYELSGSNRYFLPGSQRNLLQMPGSHKGFSENREDTDKGCEGSFTPAHWSYFPPEWQLIQKAKRPKENKGGNERFGYGLDLI